MNATVAASLLVLRAADPAANADVTDVGPSWARIAATLDRDDYTISIEAPSRKRQWRVAVAVVAAAVTVAVALIVGVVAWPWSSGGPAAVAYGVTRQANGTVAVRVSVNQPLSAAELQSRLRSAGVPAVVLTQSSGCNQPAPAAVELNRPVISHPTTITRTEGFVIDPAAIPAGADLLVELPSFTADGKLPATAAAFSGLIVTDQVPTCVAPSPAGPPSPSATSS